jgi:thiol-disulfide isomerase/thioredoxin
MNKLLLGVFLMSSFSLFAQEVEVVSTAWIDKIKANKSDTIYIINFWATWCKPCVAELPEFERLGTTYANEKVKVLLVSTDMRKDLNTRLKDFIATKKMQQQVLFMDEVNADKWINKVNEE